MLWAILSSIILFDIVGYPAQEPWQVESDPLLLLHREPRAFAALDDQQNDRAGLGGLAHYRC